MDEIDDKARKVQEVLNGLGWTSDANQLIARIKQLNDGLVQEDEFAYLLCWSERCLLSHKLDQLYLTPKAKDNYTIPDLFVLIDNNGVPTPYLIEVKTSKEKKLSWTKRYYEGLINYSKLMGIPVLVAWKWKSFDTWTLFDLSHFELAVSNYKIDLQRAHQESLMSKLLGDYVIIPYHRTQMHFKFRKEKLLSVEGNRSNWHTIVESIYITGKDGNIVSDINGLFSFFAACETNEVVTETETHIIQSFVPTENQSVFAQSIPLRYIKMFNDGDVNWLDRIKREVFPIAYSKLDTAIKKSMKLGVVRNIYYLQARSDKSKPILPKNSKKSETFQNKTKNRKRIKRKP